MRARSLAVGSMMALLLTAACADGPREAKRLPPGVGEPADLEPAPTVSADPFVPQATGDTSAPAFSEQVDGGRVRDGTRAPAPRARPGDGARRDPAPLAVVPAPTADPTNPEVIARRAGGGLAGTPPGDPTAQVIGNMGQSQAAPATPPPQGGFVVVGPGEVTDGSGAAPILPPPGQ